MSNSLDDTLKEILEETPAIVEEPVVEKPKRGRRSKAQIEAEKKAQENLPTDSLIGEPLQSSKDEQNPTSTESVEETSANIEATTSEDIPVEVEITPEVLPDDSEVVETPTSDNDEPASEVVEEFIPEIVADTPEDALPDIETTKDTKKTAKPVIHETASKDEAREALNNPNFKPTDPNSLVGKSFVLKHPTTMYRTRHTSMRIKPYQGLVTVIEDAKSGFVKIQFLRQGFGLCDGFLQASVIQKLAEGGAHDKSPEV